MPATFAIGDIHGALKALEQLMIRMDARPGDRLIFLGDYVDGWSQPAQVIDFLMELDKTHPCIFLKGNHDIWCQAWLRGEMPDREWLLHGGKATIKSYDAYTPEQRALHLAFFNGMQDYFIDEANRLFVHAGFTSMHGPQNETYESNFSWDRTLWEVALTTGKGIKKDSKRYPKRLLLFNEIYIGHTPTVNYDTDKPMQACNVWNIDTGAAFNGRLTGINVETKQYWQSDIVQQLYPNEKGRNQ